MNERPEKEDYSYRPIIGKARVPRYWCGHVIMIVFFGILAISATISIFVTGYEPRPIDWFWYVLYILATIILPADLWNEKRKRKSAETSSSLSDGTE